MKRYADRHRLTTLSELNVTPLIDLAFVLLIIFMITTPLMENAIDLIVPTSTAANAAVDPDRVRVIEIDRNEALTFEGRALTMEQLKAVVERESSASPDAAIVIRPHRDLPVQRFIHIVDAVQEAGITRIGVLTLPEEE